VRPEDSRPGLRAYRILELLRTRITASFSGLAAHFGVSEMTIRRDIAALDATGQVIRIPGGIRLARGIVAERPFLERIRKHSAAKSRIGAAAAALVADGDTVVLDSGTTTLHIARHLKHRPCTVFTFSIAALEELAQSHSAEVRLFSGIYRAASHDLIGPPVSEGLAHLRAAKVFFGAAAISADGAVMVYDAEAPRTLLQSAREKILVVDSAKLGQEALYRFCALADCDLLITDAAASPALLRKLRRHVRIKLAK
jgi:DeoR/GlpR family transcriptional regulator of sugar metabolism